jgi:hypothetical protein
MNNGQVSSSFRDPSGFLFIAEDGNLYRQINVIYQQNYEMLMDSGLYDELTASRFLVAHEEVELSLKRDESAYKIICPDVVPFISYPYEWCFSQLKDAALLTLNIQKMGLRHGMSLKDASNYNVQFMRGSPVFIDTLSFERYREEEPWVAYRQFCEHFLAPLLIMKYIDPRFIQLLRVYIDGIPLDIAARMLPFRTKINPRLLFHIHLHARSKSHYAGEPIEKRGKKFSKLAMLGFIDSLEGLIENLTLASRETEWADYYSDTNYSAKAHDEKKRLVRQFLDTLGPRNVWDLGANDGTFSRLASDKRIPTISFDMDPACVEESYQKVRRENEESILPLLMDLTNPSPDLGWDGAERDSFATRGPCDTLMALALIHHLAISNNVPLTKIASSFRRLCHSLIIEWIPKVDTQVRRLLATRTDTFDDYSKESFESSFKHYFDIIERSEIRGSVRVIYLMKGREKDE